MKTLKDLKFSPITIEDKPIFDEFFINNDSISSVNDFSTIFCWNVSGQARYAIADDVLIIYNIYEGKKVYYFPINKSKQNIRPYVEMILEFEDCNCHYIAQAEESVLDQIKDIEGYDLIKDRDFSDYIYLSKDLQELKGKKYHAKRNHLNKFINSYKYVFREYTESDYEQCIELYDLWLSNSKSSPAAEKTALDLALKNYKALDLKGGVIEIDGKIRAFSINSILPNKKAGNVLFEKADINYDGIFAAINNFSVKEFFKDIEYVNRQEDMGIEGLRKAKLSYHPVFILSKYRLVCNGDKKISRNQSLEQLTITR
ncbi:MAG TPA: phosphatidylglycerol lysyltransferase domain-containing protein [Clostridia bacterium]